MKARIKRAIDYAHKQSDLLMVPLYLLIVLTTAIGRHKLNWFDAAFLISYTLLVRKKE
jgi:hypothetical protein